MSALSNRKKVINLYKESRVHHCIFGLKVSTRLLIASLLLFLNSLLPFVPIPRMFGIHDTSHWLGGVSFKRKQDRMKYMRGL